MRTDFLTSAPESLSPTANRLSNVVAGVPVFPGTRVPVQCMVEHLRAGRSLESFEAECPGVSREQIVGAILFGLETFIERASAGTRLGAAQSGARSAAAMSAGNHFIERGDNGVIINAALLSAVAVVRERVLCPGCRAKVFLVWPTGWDTHAAHRCEGLNGITSADRKAEYKRRWSYLFR